LKKYRGLVNGHKIRYGKNHQKSHRRGQTLSKSRIGVKTSFVPINAERVSVGQNVIDSKNENVIGSRK